MRRMTDTILTDEILKEVGVDKFIEVAQEKLGEKIAEKKIKKILNEFYQYHPKTHSQVLKKDYSYLKKIVEESIYNFTHI